MNFKMIVAGILGGITFFLAGWLVFGIALMDTLTSYSNASCMRPEEEMSLPLLAVANLLWGLVFAYIFSKWPSINSFGSGALQGAILSVLLGFATDLFFYIFTTLNTSFVIAFYNAIGNAVLGAIGGGVIGWWLGRK